MQTPKNSVHSVDKAMELIELLTARRAPMTLTELAAAAGYPKSTVHALLATLLGHGMIEQRADGRYYLGLRLFECGSAVAASWDVSAAAAPLLDRLSAAVGATAFLSVLEGGTAMSFLQSAAGDMHVVQELGCRLPLHCTSQGKILLAGRTDAARLLKSSGMTAYTPHTVTDPDQLLGELAMIRARGCAVEDGEYKIGLRSVSAPVFDVEERLRYAVGVVGFFRRVRSEEFERAADLVKKAAAELSWNLGSRKNAEERPI